MLLVSRRGAEVGPLARRLGAELERDVEVLRPELHQRRIPVGLLGAQLLQHRAGEAVEVAERPRGTGSTSTPVERPSRSSSPAALAHQLGALDPDLAVGAVPSKKGVPKPPRVKRSAISFSGFRAGATTSSATWCSARAVSANAPGSGSSAPPGAEPALGAPVGDLGRSARDLVPGQVAVVADGRDQLAALGHLAGRDGIVGEGLDVDRGRRGLQHPRLEVAAQDVLGLGSGVAHGGP